MWCAKAKLWFIIFFISNGLKLQKKVSILNEIGSFFYSCWFLCLLLFFGGIRKKWKKEEKKILRQEDDDREQQKSAENK
jgi:hypothetical protein